MLSQVDPLLTPVLFVITIYSLDSALVLSQRRVSDNCCRPVGGRKRPEGRWVLKRSPFLHLNCNFKDIPDPCCPSGKCFILYLTWIRVWIVASTVVRWSNFLQSVHEFQPLKISSYVFPHQISAWQLSTPLTCSKLWNFLWLRLHLVTNGHSGSPEWPGEGGTAFYCLTIRWC